MSNVVIAPKGAKVEEPVYFTGKVIAVNLLQKNGSANAYFSVVVDGLPSLKGEDGKRITILRTKKQMIKDMDRMVSDSAHLNGVYLSAKRFWTGRNATFLVSGHEAGALVPITEQTPEEVKAQYKNAKEYPAKTAGFWLPEFISVDYHDKHLKERGEFFDTLSQTDDDDDFGFDMGTED